MEEAPHECASFLTQSNALMRKNLSIQKRNIRANVLLVLFPALVCLMFFGIQKEMDKFQAKVDKTAAMKFPANNASAIPHPIRHPGLLQIPNSNFRATQANNTADPNYYPDLPPNTCKAEGSCPVSILLTGMNRSLAESLGQNFYGIESLNETSDSLDALTIASKFILGSSIHHDESYIYIVQQKCPTNFTLRVSFKTDVDDIFVDGNVEDVGCVEGLQLWREKPLDIIRELSNGYIKGNSESKVDEFLGAYDFSNTNDSIFNVTVWYNVTDLKMDNEVETTKILRATNMASNSYLRFFKGSHVQLLLDFFKDVPNFGFNVSSALRGLYSPAISLLFVWVIESLLPVMLTSLVYEKQRNLRMIMKMHGLGDFPYWIINYTYFLIVSSTFMFCFVSFGSLLRLQVFRLNNYNVQFVFYFLYINLQIALAIFTSTLFSNVKTVQVIGKIYVFASGIIGVAITTSLSGKSSSRTLIKVLEIFPCFALSRGLYELSKYSEEADYAGIHRNWKSIVSDNERMLYLVMVMIVEWPILLMISYYLDQVGSNGSGVRKHPLWFLPCFQGRSKRYQQMQSDHVQISTEKSDVSQEREKVEKLVLESNQSHIIICDDLKKSYPPRDGNPMKHAVRGLSLALPQGECFGMLGPNGAGKTSFISMMTGLTTPTSGVAFITGLDIREDMDKVYTRMGVCPQHDLLWDVLTGREHLLFYGRLKNLKEVELTQAVEESLKSVNLLDKGDKRAGQYSGGMKRRLSVAISLIGNPKVVYLDEPSTGLDPASKKTLWSAVQCAKKDKAIILTTHSMEEAEFLCDRVGIFVDGNLQCIGNPKQLRARYGGYFLLTITTAPNQEEDVEKFLHILSPRANKVYHISGTMKFHLPKQEVRLADIFREIEKEKRRLNIQDWGIADATLEDVFIKVAKNAQSIS